MAELHFRVSPSILGPLGAEQLNDPALAVLELIKNSWDADATTVRVVITKTSISVADNGHGMSVGEIESNWLLIGASAKRRLRFSAGGRPVIGEKGLGRLATAALGSNVSLETRRKGFAGARIAFSWSALRESKTLDGYKLQPQSSSRGIGTTTRIEGLSSVWTDEQTDILLGHLRFLVRSVGSTSFKVGLRIHNSRVTIPQQKSLAKLFEASIQVAIGASGTPTVNTVTVNGKSFEKIDFDPIAAERKHPSLAGAQISIQFFRRNDGKAPRIPGDEQLTLLRSAAEEYSGVRIYVDDVNIPPYGIGGNDWCHLEKQRTATGGPTLTPGNSQIFGEVLLSKDLHPHTTITAGRNGFADQRLVRALAVYCQWAVRQIAKARRAEVLGIREGPVPNRTDSSRARTSSAFDSTRLRSLLKQASSELKNDQKSTREVLEAIPSLLEHLEKNEEDLRLFAQLASSGLAATSFAHELRASFDNAEDVLETLEKDGTINTTKRQILFRSWQNISSFAQLFKLLPLKVRRKTQDLTKAKLSESALVCESLAKARNISYKAEIEAESARVVLAELDAIILNLATNSIKAIDASENHSRGKIIVRISASKNGLEVTVEDNGIGIADADRELIFKPGEGRFEEGTGMGLPIVQYLAERYSGHAELIKPRPTFNTALRVVLSSALKALPDA